jgi:hypothetical protein
MSSKSTRTTFAMAVMFAMVFVVQTVSGQSTSGSTSQVVAKPNLEKNEGERRIWRDPPPGDFILKLSPKNNGSQHLVMVTEEMAPGDEFPRNGFYSSVHSGECKERGTGNCQCGMGILRARL